VTATPDPSFFVPSTTAQPALSALLPTPPSPTVATVPPPSTAPVASSVVIDERTRRMIETAIRAFQVVVLAGAPGTGKGTLLQEVVQDIERRPAHYGFQPRPGASWPNPIKRTPDDSWSSFELVGGLAPSGQQGTLRWSPGLFLDAIQGDRWIVLDEINRAELDKIFGPLLTWLAGESVSLGTLTTAPGAPDISLGWNDDPVSDTTPAGGVASQSGQDIEYLAGRDWRLLATYNPQDADRVFGIGQALGRRMKIVPIPLLRPADFRPILDKRYPAIPIPYRRAIAGLYQAHFESAAAQLGPAVFFEIARYVAAVVSVSGTSTAAVASGPVAGTGAGQLGPGTGAPSGPGSGIPAGQASSATGAVSGPGGGTVAGQPPFAGTPPASAQAADATQSVPASGATPPTSEGDPPVESPADAQQSASPSPPADHAQVTATAAVSNPVPSVDLPATESPATEVAAEDAGGSGATPSATEAGIPGGPTSGVGDGNQAGDSAGSPAVNPPESGAAGAVDSAVAGAAIGAAGISSSPLSADDQKILAEGYVVAVGRFLSRYREEFELRDLGEHVEVRQSLGGEWSWVLRRVQDLR
jgi:MoxR-like ATPase